MSEIINTRIRYVASKDVDLLISYVNSLPYKIEIKGNPILKGKKWFLFFILPDNANKEIITGDLD